MALHNLVRHQIAYPLFGAAVLGLYALMGTRCESSDEPTELMTTRDTKIAKRFRDNQQYRQIPSAVPWHVTFHGPKRKPLVPPSQQGGASDDDSGGFSFGK